MVGPGAKPPKVTHSQPTGPLTRQSFRLRRVPPGNAEDSASEEANAKRGYKVRRGGSRQHVGADGEARGHAQVAGQRSGGERQRSGCRGQEASLGGRPPPGAPNRCRTSSKPPGIFAGPTLKRKYPSGKYTPHPVHCPHRSVSQPTGKYTPRPARHHPISHPPSNHITHPTLNPHHPRHSVKSPSFREIHPTRSPPPPTSLYPHHPPNHPVMHSHIESCRHRVPHKPSVRPTTCSQWGMALWHLSASHSRDSSIARTSKQRER